MKNILVNTARLVIISLAISLSVHQRTLAATHPSGGPDHLTFSVNIPESLQAQIVRQDFENETIFSLKNGDKTAFLFSITRLTADQWMKVKDQTHNYSIIENKDGYITYVQRTDQTRIKGSGDTQFQQALSQMDAMISSIQINK